MDLQSLKKKIEYEILTSEMFMSNWIYAISTKHNQRNQLTLLAYIIISDTYHH